MNAGRKCGEDLLRIGCGPALKSADLYSELHLLKTDCGLTRGCLEICVSVCDAGFVLNIDSRSNASHYILFTPEIISKISYCKFDCSHGYQSTRHTVISSHGHVVTRSTRHRSTRHTRVSSHSQLVTSEHAAKLPVPVVIICTTSGDIQKQCSTLTV